MSINRRVILIVLDSVGIGALPDAHLYNDLGANTLGHIYDTIPNIKTPHLIKLGLGNIDLQNSLPKEETPMAHYGKAMEVSAGKDTTTGHWEIAGSILEKPFPTFEDGFPLEFISEFEREIGRKTIGNYSASGTEIIQSLGDKHIQTGFPIVYTSADSVFQIAAHEEIIPLDQLYEICTIARKILTGPLEVGRVIARPFTGTTGNYTRTANRKDFAILPPYNMMDCLQDDNIPVHGIGKIYDIFAGKGISTSVKTPSNLDGIQKTLEALDNVTNGLIFTNLVDFDMHYGHRRDVVGYAQCLEEFDRYIPEILSKLKDEDILIITADHGNDPTHHGTDHTREYIPILVYHNHIKIGKDLGIRESYADIAASITRYFGLSFNTKGQSFDLQMV
ncbi:MAG: phosphopentomutase [Saprospiraceae bacterium]